MSHVFDPFKFGSNCIWNAPTHFGSFFHANLWSEIFLKISHVWKYCILLVSLFVSKKLHLYWNKEESHLSSLLHCNKWETAQKDSRELSQNILYNYTQLIFKCVKHLSCNTPGAEARQRILYKKPINIK